MPPRNQPIPAAARYEAPTTRSKKASATGQQTTPRNTRRALISLDLSHAHHQQQSPLWSKLPAEIRNQIFELAVSQHLDSSRPYPDDSFYRRPGYTHAFRVCTALLQTCRLAWAETRSIPMRSATIPIWESSARGPSARLRPHGITSRSFSPRSSALTAANVRDLQHVHFFPQLYYFESHDFARLFASPRFQPRRITITIRHTDWWWWENDEDLHVRSVNLTLPAVTEELVIEFETLVRKKHQLDPIVDHWRRSEIFSRRGDNAIFSAHNDQPKEWTWSGEIDGWGVQHYVVAVVKWTPYPHGHDLGRDVEQ
ncbi:hypothetical protein BKA81DRAFT_409914 [Phyllosticta paracitricarpa]|uniref:Uncharacterized protein n=2 Tax=Phyllosticta TaxID=121621 RepID=A0ABR1LBC4_9PEZI